MTAPVRLRELRAGEYDVLDAVHAELSPASRHHRFHSGAPRLHPQVRERLAAVDGREHVAVAAFAGTTPVGIARLIALGDGLAELAVEVVDTWHRRGIGTWLVRAVVDRGRTAGIRLVVADVLAENLAAQILFAAVFPDHSVVDAGPELRLVAVLPVEDSGAWAA